MHVGVSQEPLQQVIAPDAIAAIRRVRQALRKEQNLHSASAGCPSRLRITRAGTPAAITSAGSGRVTTAPAPTTVPLPTSARTTALLPIQAPAPICTSRS